MFEYKSCRMYSNYDATFWPLRAVIDTIGLTFKLKRANPQSIGRLGWIVGKGNVQVPIYFSKESEKKNFPNVLCHFNICFVKVSQHFAERCLITTQYVMLVPNDWKENHNFKRLRHLISAWHKI